MEKVVLNQLKLQLDRQRRELLGLATRAISDGRSLRGEEPQDPADRAVVNSERELLFHQGSQNHVQLRLVEAALRRIDDGTYGECLRCGKDIGIRRLTAMPFANYCLTCQEAIEKQRGEPRAA